MDAAIKAVVGPLRGSNRELIAAGVTGASVAIIVIRYILRALAGRSVSADRSGNGPKSGVFGEKELRGLFWETVSEPTTQDALKSQAVAAMCDSAFDGLTQSCEKWESALQQATVAGDLAVRTRIRKVLRRLYATLDVCEERSDGDNDSFVSAHSDMYDVEEIDGLRSYESAEVITDSGPLSPRRSSMKPNGTVITNGERTRDVDVKTSFYAEAMKLATQGEIKCRRVRAKMVGCASDTEFLAKVHCLRQALNIALEDVAARNWFVQSTRDLIAAVFRRAHKDAAAFLASYDNMMAFVLEAAEDSAHAADGHHGRHHGRHHNQSHGTTAAGSASNRMRVELLDKGVVCVSLYDVAFDFLILDAFEDLESPPAALISVMQNTWIPQSMKEKALSTAVWSIVAAKSQSLTDRHGFLSRFYNLSTHTSPVFAYGFLGPAGELKETCEFFKDQMVGFVRDMFSSENGRYDSVERLASDIMAIAKRRVVEAQQRLR
eukprot:Opistho-2@41395